MEKKQKETKSTRCVASNNIYSIQSFCDEFLGFCPMIRGDRDELRMLMDNAGYEELWDYPLNEIDEVLEHGSKVVLVDTSYVDKVNGEYQTVREYRWVEIGEE